MTVVLKTYFTFNFASFLFLCATRGDITVNETEKQLVSLKLPPCQACKMVVDSFLKGMERTARTHFGGGDTAWQEEKLGAYATSEVRLVEIQEEMCDEDRAKVQCLTLVEDWEQHLEDWWLRDSKATPDLMQYLCIETVQYCCPSGRFGPECQPCPGFPHGICNNNGKCIGNGTRKGSGKCSCNKGYTGEFCNECDLMYYTSYKDDDKLLCSHCHVSCEGGCTHAGPKGCLVCKHGWSKHEEGCVDVNECFSTPTPCTKNEFCVNNEGAYSCLACDQSCNGCTGDGPDMCEECASGYVLKDNLCVDFKNLSSDSDNTTRYLTYLGLCIATCIVFQKRPMVASGLGLFVALYVTTSEYMLGSLQTNHFLSSFLKYFKS